MARRAAAVCALTLALAANARAQSGSSGTSTGQSSTSAQTSSSSTAQAEETRPATTTFNGDTGLWYVPTAEVLGKGQWSTSVYRRGTNWVQGYTNVADFAGTFAYGIGGRAEVFGSFLVDTRIDRDSRPVFGSDPAFGSFIDRYPKVNQYWTGDNVGDLYVGAKFNILSESRQDPVALALRAMVKAPTGKADAGVSTGKPDFSVDGVLSKEAAKLVEVSGYGGYEWRGSPDGFDIPSGAFRWGTGLTFPSRNFLRLVGEVNGYVPSKDVATASTALIGIDGSRSLLTANTENITRATLGLTLQTKKGFFFGAGVSWNVPLAWPHRLVHRRARRHRRLLRHAVPDRLPPGSEGLRAAATTAPPAAASTDPGADSQPVGEGRVRSVHGGSGQDVDRDGDRAGLDQLFGDVSLDRAERHARAAGGTLDAVDRAAAGRQRAGDGHGDLPVG